MHELDEPVGSDAVAASELETPASRTREIIRAEWRALAERLKSLPRDSEEAKRLRAGVLALWAEEVDYISEEEFAENREFHRELDSHRPPGQKLFPHLAAEGGA